MDLSITGKQYDDDAALVTLCFMPLNDWFYKVLKVTLKDSGRSYFFYENEFIDIEENPEQDVFRYIDYTQEINTQASIKAIKAASFMDSIDLKDLSLDEFKSISTINFFKSFKVSTSAGSICIGYGKKNDVFYSINCYIYWPTSFFKSTLHGFTQKGYNKLMKGKLFSLIGYDNLKNLLGPDYLYTNPTLIEFTRA